MTMITRQKNRCNTTQTVHKSRQSVPTEDYRFFFWLGILPGLTLPEAALAATLHSPMVTWQPGFAQTCWNRQ